MCLSSWLAALAGSAVSDSFIGAVSLGSDLRPA
jgi:hypothetical protein